jgi:ribulose-5-phosphate 4-epimerase/fuculose-1-phosphate aldolase
VVLEFPHAAAAMTCLEDAPRTTAPIITLEEILNTSTHATRRRFLGGAVAMACGLALPVMRGHAAQASAGPADALLIEDLVAANRILAMEGIVDGYGHVSVRHDKNPERFLISRSIAPELVTSADIVELDLDGNATGEGKQQLYLERFIHGEIYKRRPDVRSIVHHHAASIIAFGITKVPMRPVYHMAGFVGAGVPVFEIRDAGGTTDMLVRNPSLGKALAETLGDKPAALMRGHGAVVVGATIAEAVARSYYLQMNAKLQAQALAMGGEITYLSDGEVEKLSSPAWYDRAWGLWKSKVTPR